MTRLPFLTAGLVCFALFALLGEKWWGVLGLVAGIYAAFRTSPADRPQRLERAYTSEQRRVLAGLACTYCGRQVHYESACPFGGCDADYQADHVDPWSQGGATTLDNAVVSCRWCNQHKSDRPVDEFLEDPDGDGVPGLRD